VIVAVVKPRNRSRYGDEQHASGSIEVHAMPLDPAR
jgi:hypothetical protein